jgi:hypothetical protein
MSGIAAARAAGHVTAGVFRFEFFFFEDRFLVAITQ